VLSEVVLYCQGDGAYTSVVSLDLPGQQVLVGTADPSAAVSGHHSTCKHAGTEGIAHALGWAPPHCADVHYHPSRHVGTADAFSQSYGMSLVQHELVGTSYDRRDKPSML